MTSHGGYDAIPANTDEEQPLVDSPPSPASCWQRIKSFEYQRYLRTHPVTVLLGSVLFFLLLGVAIFPFLPQDSGFLPITYGPPIQPGISWVTLENERVHCSRRGIPEPPSTPRSNARAPKDVQSVLIKNAVVWDGEGHIENNVDILMVNGIIKQVQPNLSTENGTKIIDAKGHIVGPGLVDMHTHLGLSSWPFFLGTSDVNEETDPLTPFVRALDAFNPSDMSFRIVASGGITTALVLPGSGNIMGGEAYAFKLRPVLTNSNEDMLVQAGEDETTHWRWMKMACGENPKKVYGRQGKAPMTRKYSSLSCCLGEAYLLRKRLEDAHKLMQKQDDWCELAQDLTENDHIQLNSRFPSDLSLESLVALLRGQVRLNIHCYEGHDIEAMIRHSIEFNYTISAFHHALSAYRIPEIIKRAPYNITVATFADNWGYKKEAYDGSPFGPKILYEAGIPVALKSDHPVVNSQHLIFEAAKSSYYGLPAQEAFKSVTSVPAKAIGLGHRVGSLKVGYDADIVIWDRPPLDLGAAPLQVFIDGVPLFDETTIAPAKEAKKSQKQKMSVVEEGLHNFVLTNISAILLDDKVSATTETSDQPMQMTVQDGKIICTGVDCVDSSIHAFGTTAYTVIDTCGGYVLPGIIGVGSKLGMVAIPLEPSTGDGIHNELSIDVNNIPEAIDGIKLDTRPLREAYKGGVMTVVSAPLSTHVVVGLSAAFHTSAKDLLSDGSLISPAVALHLQIGDNFKSKAFPTISSQISYLRHTFIANNNTTNYFGKAVRGEIPVVIRVDNKDEIASLIRLKQDHFPKMRMALLGGIEAHLVAPYLAAAKISVVLSPTLCTPAQFNSVHCLTGAPLTNGTAAHVLHRHGVKLGLGIEFDSMARNLAWDAGWLSATSPSEDAYISEVEAIKMITTNLQEIYGLQDNTREMSSEFVLWSGSPLSMESHPVLAYSQHGIHLL
ncbi:hypothetical protein BDF14DRAFT_1995995 [Spinellus fusiger]|nr:hypothetical protein BDF14DRAFT_1995995 [Spinellus fusiger]